LVGHFDVKHFKWLNRHSIFQLSFSWLHHDGMTRALALTSALLLNSGVAATLEGTYNLTQEFPAGRKAEAKLKITRTGDALRFEWDQGARVGLGLQVGDNVAVAFGGPECGVVAYERRGNTFSGAWTTSGQTKGKGTETFTWDGQKKARSGVTGTNPDGSTYKGQLLLGVQNEFSVLKWEIGKDVTSGIGLLSENFFAVAFGAETCAVGLYKVQGDGRLNGHFFQGEERAGVPLREVAVNTVRPAVAPASAINQPFKFADGQTWSVKLPISTVTATLARTKSGSWMGIAAGQPIVVMSAVAEQSEISFMIMSETQEEICVIQWKDAAGAVLTGTAYNMETELPIGACNATQHR